MNSSFLAFVILSLSNIGGSSADKHNTCSPSQSSCEFWLTVEERLILHWKNIRVYAKDGVLYRHDEGPGNHKTQIPPNEVITMDGVERAVVVANNSIPGPPIVAYRGQWVIVHVTNHLLSESVTIHWHGIHQRGTPYSDGVAFISQCPIMPGQLFSYKFKASTSGTFFYHSHVGGQRVDGLFGALIIKPNKTETKEEEVEDHIMHVGDWYHDRASELHAKMIYGNFKTKSGFVHPETLDGVKFAPYGWKSAYIEGKGQYFNPESGNWTETPLKVYNVTKGKKYRFRVIGSGMIVPLRISVDGHRLSAVATDGYEVEPESVESLIINPGERYDFIITANQSVGNYWIRVDSMEHNEEHHYARAILRYEGAVDTEPATSRIACTQLQPCKVLNCMFSYYPEFSNTTCVQVDDLSASNADEDLEELPEFVDGDSKEIMLNFVAGDGRMVVNGNIFEHPAVSSFTQPKDIRKDIMCNYTSCVGDKNCYCYNELTVPKDQIIQMVWTNHGIKGIRHHPIHLHGHSFHVLKIGFGKYNESTGQYLGENTDINCPTSYCNQPQWKSGIVGGSKVPGLKTTKPIQKDTLMVPAGAYAVIRFRSDNPGKWFLHCHIEFHSMQGMAMVVNEAPDHHVPRPNGFPICQNFYSDEDKNILYEKAKVVEADDDDNKNMLYLVLFITFLALFVIENIILIVRCCCCQRILGNKTNVEMTTKS